jgi:hypothetical protein
MKILLSLVVIIVTCTGCGLKNNNMFLHEGYIRVELGGLEAIKKEILIFSTLTRKEQPKIIEVNLWKNKDVVYVSFNQGISTYDFVNLITWLDNPPDNEEVGCTEGWVKSGTTGEEYYLYPEEDNERGDTLLGASEKNLPIRVYLPEAAISPISRPVAYKYKPKPLFNLGNPDLSFNIEIDVVPTFGNNEFVLTHEKDSTWGY